MPEIDLNLLTALDVLLREKSVAAAAQKLNLSTSAMSRTLSRLRVALGDPVLVPAGRTMVATPHAEAIAEQVGLLAENAHRLLSPAPAVDISRIQRDFTIRANDAFVLLYAARLSTAVTQAAPGIRLRFTPKPDKDIQPLRDGRVDLDIGVMSGDGAELRGQTLFEDDFVGVAKAGHPLLDTQPVTPEHYSECLHVVSSRRGKFGGPMDEALAALGLSRKVNLVVPSYPAVMAIAAATDMVGIVPRAYCEAGNLLGIEMFELPVSLPGFTITQTWHPRMEADPIHRWIRALIFDSFHRQAAAVSSKPGG